MLKLHNLVILRKRITDKDELISDWFINGNKLCVGLENALKAIPAGSYVATRSYSPKFKDYYYELANVPNRKEILIHPANAPHELQGCLAPGSELAPESHMLTIFKSQAALNALYLESKSAPLIVSVIDDI